MLTLLKTLWTNWKLLVRFIVRAQSVVLMAITYVTAVGPVYLLLFRSKKRRLDTAAPDDSQESFGHAVVADTPDIRRAQRPW